MRWHRNSAAPRPTISASPIHRTRRGECHDCAAAFGLPRTADLAVHGAAAAAGCLAGLGQPAGARSQALARRRQPDAKLRNQRRSVLAGPHRRLEHARHFAAGRRSAALERTLCRGTGLPCELRYSRHLRRQHAADALQHPQATRHGPAHAAAPERPRCHVTGARNRQTTGRRHRLRAGRQGAAGCHRRARPARWQGSPT